jgi:hypothetical protein
MVSVAEFHLDGYVGVAPRRKKATARNRKQRP